MWLFTVILIAAMLAVLGWSAFSKRQSVRGELTPQGRFDLEVVGESHYQPALRAEAGRGEVRHKCRALLVLEDGNPYDDQAVRVDVGARTVGYLSRRNARIYRRLINDLGNLECDAVIVGGGKGRSLGIWLDVTIDDD